MVMRSEEEIRNKIKKLNDQIPKSKDTSTVLTLGTARDSLKWVLGED